MTRLARALAELCCTDWRQIFNATQQAELTAIVRTALIDTAACMLAGRSEDATRVAVRWTLEPGGQSNGASSLLFGSERASSSVAALLNAVAGHALDFDDVGLSGHPSVVLVPALWAEHERLGTRGFDLVQAYAKGYAVWRELQRRQRTSLHARGWHPSAVFGAVGATAVVCTLRGLPAQEFSHALGISASLAAGVVANFGSMTKALQVGRASQAGILAAELAQAGLDASPDALDGAAGLLSALAGEANVDLSPGCSDDLPFTLLRKRPGVKKYPVCYATHRVVDGLIDLARVHGFPPEAVDRIDAVISETAAGVLRHHSPTNLGEARFSLEFAAAAALRFGQLGIAEVSEAALADPEVRELMGRVHVSTVQTQCPLEPSFAYADNVSVRLRDGRVLESGPIRFARGHAELPLTADQIRDKLLACAGAGGSALAQDILARIDAALA